MWGQRTIKFNDTPMHPEKCQKRGRRVKSKRVRKKKLREIEGKERERQIVTVRDRRKDKRVKRKK
jgi:hypothetical protein